MSNEVKSGGVGFTGLLALIFITLKLLGVLTWSWWWVLAPIWIPAIIVALVTIIIMIVTLID